MPHAPGWTEQQFRKAAAESTTLRQMMTTLGLSWSGGANRTLHKYAQKWDVDLPLSTTGPKRTWTDPQFQAAIHRATSLSDLARRLNLTPNGKQNQVFRRHAERLGLTLPG